MRQGRSRALVALSRELHSMYALRLACQLSRLGHLNLNLVHVVENGALPRGAGWAPHTWARERELEVRRELDQLVRAEQEFCDLHGGLSFEHGRPEERLLRRLQRGDCDLLILGGHPSGQPGSLLNHLAKESPVPLLVARGARPLRRVLMCSDGTAASERTLSFMGRLLGESSVEVTLASTTAAGNGSVLARGRELLQAEGVEPRLCFLEGPDWAALLAETARGDYDLLVAAQAHPASGLRALFGGDPLVRLALHAPCPVLMQARAA